MVMRAPAALLLLSAMAGSCGSGDSVDGFDPPPRSYTADSVVVEDRREPVLASRISRAEGMEGHARACDWRLRKYFPGEDWPFEVYDQKRYD